MDEYHYDHLTIKPRYDFEGMDPESLEALARVLAPYIKAELERADVDAS